ncbi:MAG: hypothetical protein IJM15_02605 [Erysipelotrichaceae bacterium]|nr:hypothetical protein [Erysipelotrichaceae bacterium]
MSTKQMQEYLHDGDYKHIVMDNKGKYRWVYELPMLKSLFLLAEVWKVLAFACVIVLLFGTILTSIDGTGLDSVLSFAGMLAIVFGILLVLSIPAYLIVMKANNGKYTVLFEMDDSGIDHIAIKTEATKALEILTVIAGLVGKSHGTTAAGALAATGGSLYSRFVNVRKIKADKANNLIRLNGKLFRNMIYVEDEDFDFVYDFIVDHCPQATVR